MRPIRLAYTPAAALTTGFKTGATGAGPFTPTTTASGDSLAHLFTITSAANLSGITFTVTGKDPDGNAQTEAIVGPNATTVTGTKYWSSVSSVSASSTLGANTADFGWSGASVSKSIVMNYNIQTFSLGFGVTITGTINYTIQHSFTDPFDKTVTMNWFNHVSVVGETANADGNYSYNIEAIRLLVNSVTAGATAVLEVLQGGGA